MKFNWTPNAPTSHFAIEFGNEYELHAVRSYPLAARSTNNLHGTWETKNEIEQLPIVQIIICQLNATFKRLLPAKHFYFFLSFSAQRVTFKIAVFIGRTESIVSNNVSPFFIIINVRFIITTQWMRCSFKLILFYFLFFCFWRCMRWK